MSIAKIYLSCAAILLVWNVGVNTATAASHGKNAESITKDLIIEQAPVPTRAWGGQAQPEANTRGIKIVPVAVDQTNPGSGRTAISVEFNYDSDVLTQDARWQLDELARALNSQALGDSLFEIIGHTDATGSDEYNMGLSKRRALSVVQYLSRVQGVSMARLYPVGMGEMQLADPLNPGSGVNRRVEVSNLGAR